MSNFWRSIFVEGLTLLLMISLSGCTTPLTPAPLPTPTPVRVSLPSQLMPLLPSLQACADAHPEIALFLEDASITPPDMDTMDLALLLGAPSSFTGFSAPIAVEEILMIVHPAISTARLSADQLLQLYTGQADNWQELGETPQAVQVWTYPNGDVLRQIFDANILDGNRTTSEAFVAPDPDAMLEGVAKQPGSIGYLPKAFINDQVRNVSIDPDLQLRLHQPVLAISAHEPEGAARVILYCLQSGEGQKAILDHYQPWENK